MLDTYRDGTYGLRRVAVDATKQLGTSREGLKAYSDGPWRITAEKNPVRRNPPTLVGYAK